MIDAQTYRITPEAVAATVDGVLRDLWASEIRYALRMRHKCTTDAGRRAWRAIARESIARAREIAEPQHWFLHLPEID